MALLIAFLLLSIAVAAQEITVAAAADLLTLGKVPDAMERLSTALHCWQTVRDAVNDGANLAGLSVDALRVPLVIAGPGTSSGTVIKTAVSLADRTVVWGHSQGGNAAPPWPRPSWPRARWWASCRR